MVDVLASFQVIDGARDIFLPLDSQIPPGIHPTVFDVAFEGTAVDRKQNGPSAAHGEFDENQAAAQTLTRLYPREGISAGEINQRLVGRCGVLGQE